MTGLIARWYPITFTWVFLATALTNAFVWRQPALGAVLLVAFLAAFGNWIGRAAAPAERGAVQTWVGAWMLLSGIMIAGSVAYYAAAFTRPVAAAIMVAAGPVAWWLRGRAAKRQEGGRPHDLVGGGRHSVAPSAWTGAAIVLAGLAATASMLMSGATTDAVRSVWAEVPSAAFLAFGMSLLVLFALLFRGRERAVSIPLASVALLVFLGAALVLFPLGFGFDPFIHQATEEHIARFGTITPKPFYYIGEYVLVLFAHHGFALPIAPVNAALVPVLAACALPIAWFAAAAHLFDDRRVAAASLAGLFLLPLSPFVLTTPQGLADLWTLLLVLAAVPAMLLREKPRAPWLAVPALAALAAHPIAGLPAVLFVILLATDPARVPARRAAARAVFWTAVAVGCVILPLSFVANSLLSTGTPGIDLGAAASLSSLASLSLFFANRFNPLLDFVYLYGYNAAAVVLALAAVGWLIARKRLSGAFRVPALLAGMLAVNWFLLSTAVDFSFLIDYERQNFAARLVPIALSFLAPFVLVAVGSWLARVRPGPMSVRAASVVLLAALATASFYMAYPRHDAYETGHGYNVSRSDLDAVHGIDADANGSSYAALANQTVSAAAIRELGFAHYFGDQFFYPIPTGGDLYALFLRMNDRPSRETAAEALAHVNARCAADPECAQPAAETLYYVVNDYWWEAPRIVETAKQTADSWWALDEGAVHVFRYDHP